MASLVGASSIYQAPTSSLSKKPVVLPANVPPSVSLSFSEKSHFNTLVSASNTRRSLSQEGTFKCGYRQSLATFVPSAIATPNSVLSEEAFKGLGDFSKDELDSDYEDEADVKGSLGGAANEEELAVSNLGLPQRLVDSLEKRGITELFPIQVWSKYIFIERLCFFLQLC